MPLDVVFNHEIVQVEKQVRVVSKMYVKKSNADDREPDCRQN